MTEADISPADVRRRLTANERALCGFVYERDDMIRMANVAVLTREHPLWVGEPGVGKSFLARLWAAQFRTRYAEFLFSRQTVETEVLCHLDLPALKAGRSEYVFAGHLPDHEIVFLDEIWKSTEGLANGMLAWLNERIVKGTFHSPLVTAIAASNEFQESDNLNALRDRFVISHVVEPIQDEDRYLRYLEDRASDRPAPALDEISLAELQAAQAAVLAVRVPGSVLQALRQLRTALGGVGVYVSDRKAAKSLPILKAYAWLEGWDEVGLEHVECLRHVLWSKPEEIPAVEAALGQINKGLFGEIRALVERTLAPYYDVVGARRADGSWESESARAAFLERAPTLLRGCQDAGQEIQRKFGEGVPDNVKQRARKYLGELKDAFVDCQKHAAVLR
jgi:MoxR-like ATPase